MGLRLPEPFAACLAETSRLVVATGVVSVWHVPADGLAADTATIEAAHPGCFLLGLGSSHAPMVESLGARYERPFSRLVDYLDALDRADPPVSRARRVLGALGATDASAGRPSRRPPHPRPSRRPPHPRPSSVLGS